MSVFQICISSVLMFLRRGLSVSCGAQWPQFRSTALAPDFPSIPAASRVVLIGALLTCVQPTEADELQPLIESSCIACHDENTETRLDFTKLDRDFEDANTFRAWVTIFDRIQNGEMPPASEPRPDTQTQTAALTLLKTKLFEVNRRQQQDHGRTPSRRLSRLEYEHTLHDLLGIGGDIARYLPPETKSDTFDVVTAKQDMSSVHVKGFLKAADVALDEAIQLGAKPKMVRELDYVNSPYMKMWFERPVRRGGGTVFRAEDDLIFF